jgi:hypothetical protein
VGRADGQVILLNKLGEQLGQPVDFGQEPIVGMDWLDERPLRLAAVTLGATVGVWDVERDNFAWDPLRYGLRASALALERGQNLLALGSDAGVLVLDAETGLLLRREKTDPALPLSLTFDLDGRVLTAALDIPSPDQYGLVSWRLRDWMPADSSNIGSAVNTLSGGAWRPHGGSERGRRYLDTKTGPTRMESHPTGESVFSAGLVP